MKSLSFLPVVVAVVLAVAFTSCTTVQPGGDEYYERGTTYAPQRIYVDDPYQGTVVLERDPVTGRYYQVSPYPYNAYSRYNTWDSRYRDRYYDRYRTQRPVYQQQRPQPTEQQIRDREKSREEARKKVLGG
ncbi:MAG TPA: hypothetical protein VFZ78_03925 [Flavisolibacter sp.]